MANCNKIMFAMTLLVMLTSTAQAFVPVVASTRGRSLIYPTTTWHQPDTTSHGRFHNNNQVQLHMAEESEEAQARRRNQQLGAAAVLAFGILYDFFVTHHGVGFWDPNYVP